MVETEWRASPSPKPRNGGRDYGPDSDGGVHCYCVGLGFSFSVRLVVLTTGMSPFSELGRLMEFHSPFSERGAERVLHSI